MFHLNICFVKSKWFVTLLFWNVFNNILFLLWSIFYSHLQQIIIFLYNVNCCLRYLFRFIMQLIWIFISPHSPFEKSFGNRFLEYCLLISKHCILISEHFLKWYFGYFFIGLIMHSNKIVILLKIIVVFKSNDFSAVNSRFNCSHIPPNILFQGIP